MSSALPDLLIWGGPVFAPGGEKSSGGDVGKVTWAEQTDILTFDHGPGGGVGSDSFAALAASMRGADGRILPNLLASAGTSPDQYNRIAIAGFSAFHGLASPLLDSDGDRIDAAVLLDACFELVGAPPKAGFESFAARAARGEKLMVFVGSSGQNGPGLPPTTKGYECAFHNAEAGAALAGVALEPTDAPDSIPAPKCGAARAHNLWVLNYCDAMPSDPHGHIVHHLTEPILQAFLPGYLAGQSTALFDQGISWGKVALAGGVVVLAGVAGVLLARRIGQ